MNVPPAAPGTSPGPIVPRASTALLFERRLWIWPLVAAGLLAVIGFWMRSKVDQAIQVQLRTELKTLLEADVEGLKIWLDTQKSNAVNAARSADVVRLSSELFAVAEQPGDIVSNLSVAPATKQLAAELAPAVEEHGYSGYIVVNRQQRVVASLAAVLLGERDLPGYQEFLAKALAGDPVVSHPFPSLILLTDKTGRTSVGVPTMYTAAPIYDEAGQIIGALGFRLKPDVDFTRILSVARGGETGETYAFNRDGLLLSESRFDDQLKRASLIADRPDSQSILQLELRNPGGDVTAGYRPAKNRADWPLTESVASAVAGDDGVNTAGYRDYRGVPVVAAWKWLPEYEFGVITEIDKAEAYAPLSIIHTVFWGLFGLLALSALAIFLFSITVSRLRQTARREALKARQLGQYTLEEKIGQGAMGVVYRGHHAMLRRPTAIKLLNVEKTTPQSIARFEREVRLTSQLNHPNTISIYDYGRTPEEIFYYAMELLDGINLDMLVRGWGPLPESRVIHILTQLCGSLNEAHGLGLIHRDIKPANIMVCQRGGMFDVVKLLDFGLVKAVDAEREAGLTAANALMGTPLYMSPEAVTNPDLVDARSDLYSLGAVAYFLLTGTAVFNGPTINEIFRRHVDARPQAPSERLGQAIDPLLEKTIVRCLEKSPAARPASALELADTLARCVAAGDWTGADAKAWWATRAPKETVDGSDAAAGTTTSAAERHDSDDPLIATIA
ncbi:MAG TPA: serine/threonine protein kinase [Planctomycetaceae bacterium]|jgi:hypothetical protein